MRIFNSQNQAKAIIGMVHLSPLPGTPFYAPDSFQSILDRAVSDAVALDEGGATGCLVQTIDRVYPLDDQADPARIAAIANIVHEIDRATRPEFQIGVQILRNAIKASLAVARVSGGNFLRCGALVGRTMTSDGMMEANALEVMRYRRQLDAGGIKLIAEIHSMHFKSLDKTPVSELAQSAVNAGADVVSLGDRDEARCLELIREARPAVPETPIFLPGYTNHENAARMLPHVDGAFVGTCLERGSWGSAVDVDRVSAYMDIVGELS